MERKGEEEKGISIICFRNEIFIQFSVKTISLYFCFIESSTFSEVATFSVTKNNTFTGLGVPFIIWRNMGLVRALLRRILNGNESC